MGQFTSVYLMMKIIILLSVLSLCASQNVESSWLRSAMLRHKRPLLRTLIQDDFFDSIDDDPELPTLDFKLNNLASAINLANDLATKLNNELIKAIPLEFLQRTSQNKSPNPIVSGPMAVLGEEESEVKGRQKAKESILARLTASEPKSVSGEGSGEKKLEIQSRENIEFARQTASEPKPINFETRSKSVSGEAEEEMFKIQGRNTHGIALALTKFGPKYSNRGTLILKRFKKLLKNAKTRGAIGVMEILMIAEKIGDLKVDVLVELIEMIVDHHVEIIGMLKEVELGDLLQEMLMEV